MFSSPWGQGLDVLWNQLFIVIKFTWTNTCPFKVCILMPFHNWVCPCYRQQSDYIVHHRPRQFPGALGPRQSLICFLSPESRLVFSRLLYIHTIHPESCSRGSFVSGFLHSTSCIWDLRILSLTFYLGKFQTQTAVERIPMCPSLNTDN